MASIFSSATLNALIGDVEKALPSISTVAADVAKGIGVVLGIDPSLASNPVVQKATELLGTAETWLAGVGAAVATVPVLEANYAENYADVAPISINGVPGRVLIAKSGGSLLTSLGL